MKLFRDKKRGPKIKAEDVIIPEAYLEYEREQEEKRREEKKVVDTQPEAEKETNDSEQMREIDSEIDAFKARLDAILNTSSVVNQDDTLSAEKDASRNKPIEIDVKRPSSAAKKETQTTASREKTQKKKSDKSIYPPQFKAFLIGIVVVVATIVVLLGPVMAIDRVDTSDLKYISHDKVVEMAGNPVGENLFRFSISKAEEELMKYPYIEDVKISRHFPHRLEINITERQPAGVLLNNSNYLQFSKDGILLDNTKSLVNLNLPLITGFKMEDVPAPGEAFKDNQRFNDILRIINACNDDLLYMLQEINIKDRNNILAYTSQGIEIRIGSVEHIEARMATLNDIINQVILSGIIEDPIEAIDIRYEKSPVVVLEGYSNIDVSDMVDQSKEGESIQEKNDRANKELEKNDSLEDKERPTDEKREDGTGDGTTSDTSLQPEKENGDATESQ